MTKSLFPLNGLHDARANAEISITGPVATTLQSPSHYDRAAFDSLKDLSDAFDPGIDAVRRPQVKDQDVVLIPNDDLLQSCGQCDAVAGGQPALEQRELQPTSLPFDQAVYLATALRIGDVVGDDVHTFVLQKSVSETRSAMSASSPN